jgi:hypothetical protein
MRALSFIPVLVLLGACSEPSAPSSHLVLGVASRSVPRSGSSTEIRFTVTNLGPQEAFLSRCGARLSAVVEEAVEGVWRQYRGATCLADNDQSALPIEPGQAVDGTLVLEREGIFRFTVGSSADPEGDYSWSTTSTTVVVFPAP